MKEKREGTYCPKCRDKFIEFKPNIDGSITGMCTNRTCLHEFTAKRYMDAVLGKVKLGIML